MTEYITPDRIANSIMQKNNDLSYLIVEGKTDYRLFKKFIDDKCCEIEIAFGNLKVIDVVSELKKRKFERIIGIIDADFRILDEEEEIDDILTTDYHDMEISFIESPSFDTLISEYSQEEKLIKSYNSIADLKKYFFELIKNLGFLKWLNKKEDLGLIFKPLNPEGKAIDYSLFISSDKLEYKGDDKLIDAILNFCNGKVKVDIKKSELIKKLDEFKKEVDLRHLCNGHDIMNVISVSFRKHISNLNSKSISANQLEKEFCLSYESRYFVTTNLYKKIKEVEKSKSIKFLSF